MKKQQIGSAHAIIVIVLVVGLLCALGYIFYRNATDKNASTRLKTTIDNSSHRSAKQLDTVKTKKYNTNLSLQYPKEWKLDRKTEDNNEVSYEVITITSPDKKTSVELAVYKNGQFGGACDPNSDSKITHIKKIPISGFEGVSYFEAITDFYDSNGKESYDSTMQVLNDTAETANAKVGASSCLIFNQKGIIDVTGDTDNLRATLQIDSSTVSNDDGTIKSLTSEKPLKKLFRSKDYQTAVKIIQSFKGEEK